MGAQGTAGTQWDRDLAKVTPPGTKTEGLGAAKTGLWGKCPGEAAGISQVGAPRERSGCSGPSCQRQAESVPFLARRPARCLPGRGSKIIKRLQGSPPGPSDTVGCLAAHPDTTRRRPGSPASSRRCCSPPRTGASLRGCGEEPRSHPCCRPFPHLSNRVAKVPRRCVIRMRPGPAPSGPRPVPSHTHQGHTHPGHTPSRPGRVLPVLAEPHSGIPSWPFRLLPAGPPGSEGPLGQTFPMTRLSEPQFPQLSNEDSELEGRGSGVRDCWAQTPGRQGRAAT